MKRAPQVVVRELARLETFYRDHKPELQEMRLYAEDFDTLKDCKSATQLGVTRQGAGMWFHGFKLTRGTS